MQQLVSELIDHIPLFRISSNVNATPNMTSGHYLSNKSADRTPSTTYRDIWTNSVWSSRIK